ncbi:MnhB domain-containing protein [Halobaculum magnesiiphilum]|uniref:Cation:proton antiporter n=1 Tax=Halobaculum magnesiiphilum TaxID=1017351 RepID=A0A8T8WD60_9EURY|nr:MnhB domain-containing protein [Halobaculum magnesiiphilum]QZP37703.1 cation:proton antiporter [Halobaculum magnesiiphilum]
MSSSSTADGDDEFAVGDAPARPYVESPIIMATVRVVAPFVFTLGAFVMFHGADSAGGGFQGGVIVGTVILMIAIAFGVGPTRDWLSASFLTVLVVFGVALFMGIGLAAVAFGGAFLEYTAIPVSHASKYGIELVEVGIGIIVSGTVVGLFFALAAGHATDEAEEVEE